MPISESRGNLRLDLSRRYQEFTSDFSIRRSPQGKIICDLPDPNQLMRTPREPRYPSPHTQRLDSRARLADFIWKQDIPRNVLALTAAGLALAIANDPNFSERGFLLQSAEMAGC